VEIETAFGAFATRPESGLLVLPSPVTTDNQALIVQLAAKYKLPAIYPYRDLTQGGGLISYGPNLSDDYRGAASRSYSEGREVSQSSRPGTDKVRDHSRPQDCQSAWSHGAAIAARYRRRDHRIKILGSSGSLADVAIGERPLCDVSRGIGKSSA
jgi:hypothetical protein